VNRTVLPIPPDPPKGSSDYDLAVYRWMMQVKHRLETDSVANTQPISPFVVGTYTAVNTVTGTDALSNFVATIVTALQAQGITAPLTKRTD